jgi:uncharacterized protein YecE (DUF72 family)
MAIFSTGLVSSSFPQKPKTGKVPLEKRVSASLCVTSRYVRLHGRNYKEWFQAENRNDHYKYPYKPKEPEGWKRRITQMGA